MLYNYLVSPRKDNKKIPVSSAKKRKTVGLALGGGASKGLAHVGVIHALKKLGVPIDYIAGTSAGAMIGGWYAMTEDETMIKKVFDDLSKKDKLLLTEVVRRKGKPVLKDKSIFTVIDKYIGDFKVEDCKIPFRAVAANVSNGDEFVISKGSLAKAIKASCAIPVVFDPIEIDGKLLLDGGVINPVPANVVRKMGADIVIAVDVSTHWFDMSSFSAKGGLAWRNLYSIFHEMFSVMSYQLAKEIVNKNADIVIRPPVLGYRWFDFNESDSIIAAGYKETRLHMEEICLLTKTPMPRESFMESFWDFVLGVKEE